MMIDACTCTLPLFVWVGITFLPSYYGKSPLGLSCVLIVCMYMCIHVLYIPLFVWVGITFLPSYYTTFSVLCTCISMYMQVLVLVSELLGESCVTSVAVCIQSSLT